MSDIARSWADWEFLGEEEDGVILVSIADCPTEDDAVKAAEQAMERAGLEHGSIEGKPQRTITTVCHDEGHEQGDCTVDSDCNMQTDVWRVPLRFEPEP